MVVPYKIIEETDEYQIRVFENFNPNDLFWHRDKEDRFVELLEGVVKFQYDNCLPIKWKKHRILYIENGVYHRIIADKRFVIKVYFL